PCDYAGNKAGCVPEYVEASADMRLKHGNRNTQNPKRDQISKRTAARPKKEEGQRDIHLDFQRKGPKAANHVIGVGEIDGQRHVRQVLAPRPVTKWSGDVRAHSQKKRYRYTKHT